jgi:hypothetical protein
MADLVRVRAVPVERRDHEHVELASAAASISFTSGRYSLLRPLRPAST